MNFREEVRGRTLNVEQVFALHAHLGHTGQQRPGVGVAGVVVDLIRGADLHDVAGIHDGHTVGDVGHDAEVMGDEDDGEVIFDPHLLQQLEDLGLNGHVQSRRGLITDQDLRVAGHSDGDDDTLAHTARELVGILLEAHFRVGDADIPQVLEGLLPGGSALEALMELHGLHDLVADGLQGVQAGHGVLHDHGDLVAADFQPVLLLF